MTALRVLAFLAGLAVVLGTTASVFTTLVVPRASSSRLMRTLSSALLAGFRSTIRRLPTYEAKDRLMALIGPLAMLLLFVLWLTLMVIGFGLISWWPAGGSFGHAFAIAGSSVFTLGVATGYGAGSATLEFVAAGFGLLVIALEIAYLPTLYSAFAAREAEVTLLASRAGTPAWGAELLGPVPLVPHHLGADRAVRRLGALGGGGVREPHQLPEPHVVPLAGGHPVVVALAHRHARRGGPLRRRLAGHRPAPGPGLHHDGHRLPALAGRHPQDPGGPRPRSDHAPAPHLRRIPTRPRAPAQRRVPLRALRRRRVAELLGLADQLRAPGGRPDAADHAAPRPWLLSRPEVGPIEWPTIVNRTPDEPEGRPPGKGLGLPNRFAE